jgi:hypothetical protein
MSVHDFQIEGAVQAGGGPFDFRLLVPRGYIKELNAGPTHRQQLPALARYRPLGSTGLTFAVSCVPLAREVDAGDFTEQILRELGHTIVQRRELRGAGLRAGCDSELFTECVVAGEAKPVLCRTRALKDGPRLWMVTAELPLDQTPSAAERSAMCLASFQLVQPSGQWCAEPTRSFATTENTRASFLYPASWVPTIVATGTEGTQVRLREQGSSGVQSFLFVEWRQANTESAWPTLVESYRDILRRSGVSLKGAALVPVEPPRSFEKAAVYAPTAKQGDASVGVGLTLVSSPSFVGSVGILGPRRASDPWQWITQKRAYHIVLNSLVALV